MWSGLFSRIEASHNLSCRVQLPESTTLLLYSKSTKLYCTIIKLKVGTYIDTWPVRLNGWVSVFKLSGCGFESRCSHLKIHVCYLCNLQIKICTSFVCNLKIFIFSWQLKNILSLFKYLLRPQIFQKPIDLLSLIAGVRMQTYPYLQLVPWLTTVFVWKRKSSAIYKVCLHNPVQDIQEEDVQRTQTWYQNGLIYCYRISSVFFHPVAKKRSTA